MKVYLSAEHLQTNRPKTWCMVPSKIQVELHEKVQKWRKQGKDALFQDVGQLRQETSMEAFEQGFLEGSQPWKGRFRATPS
jgi:hypothetical protein